MGNLFKHQKHKQEPATNIKNMNLNGQLPCTICNDNYLSSYGTPKYGTCYIIGCVNYNNRYKCSKQYKSNYDAMDAMDPMDPIGFGMSTNIFKT